MLLQIFQRNLQAIFLDSELLMRCPVGCKHFFQTYKTKVFSCPSILLALAYEYEENVFSFFIPEYDQKEASFSLTGHLM
jgi:hypothetical protein